MHRRERCAVCWSRMKIKVLDDKSIGDSCRMVQWSAATWLGCCFDFWKEPSTCTERTQEPNEAVFSTGAFDHKKRGQVDGYHFKNFWKWSPKSLLWFRLRTCFHHVFLSEPHQKFAAGSSLHRLHILAYQTKICVSKSYRFFIFLRGLRWISFELAFETNCLMDQRML